MKMYMLTQADIDLLLLRIDRDPKHGKTGGSSDGAVRDKVQQEAHDKAHRFYNYQIRAWIDEVTK
jgi:hypothetical protein